MPDFGKIVQYLDNPLALAGLALFLVVGLFRLALGLKVFRRITAVGTQQIILRTLLYAFILALVGMIGGFALAAYRAYQAGGPNTAAGADVIPPLEGTRVVATPSPIEQRYPRATRIREGRSDSSQRRLFDITIENPLERQLVLDTWQIAWRYHRGALASVARAEVVRPATRHAILLPVDTQNLAERTRVEPIEPTIVLPAASAASPSVHEFRLEMLYALEGDTTAHPAADWNLMFSIQIKTTDELSIPIFQDQQWRG